jgi:hypothetical protein
MRSLAALCLLPLAGCPAATCADSPTSLECTSVGTPPPPPEPYAFFLSGAFAVDSRTQTARGWTVGDQAFAPYLDFQIVGQAYFDEADTTASCRILLQAGASPIPLERFEFTEEYRDEGGALRTADISHLAMVWTDDVLTDAFAETSCTTPDGASVWDPDVWGPDPVGLVRQWTFGVGFGNTRPDVATWLDGQLAGDSRRSQFFGGGNYWELLGGEANYSADAYAQAIAVDAGFGVRFDAEGRAVSLEAADAEGGADALYLVYAWSGFYAEYLQ